MSTRKNIQKPGTDLALTTSQSAQLWFDEELEIFRTHTRRIHRAAVDLDMKGLDCHVEMPDIEAETVEALDGGKHDLDEATADLDEAASKDSKMRRDLKKWREENEAQRKELGLAA